MVIIVIFNEESKRLHLKPKGHWPFSPREKHYKSFSPNMGMGSSCSCDPDNPKTLFPIVYKCVLLS